MGIAFLPARIAVRKSPGEKIRQIEEAGATAGVPDLVLPLK